MVTIAFKRTKVPNELNLLLTRSALSVMLKQLITFALAIIQVRKMIRLFYIFSLDTIFRDFTNFVLFIRLSKGNCATRNHTVRDVQFFN